MILPTRKGKHTVAEYGAALNERITDEHVKEWAAGTPLTWAVESWRIAREVVYAGVAPAGDPPRLEEAYVEKAQPVVEEQIQKAGVRLATALNLAFR